MEHYLAETGIDGDLRFYAQWKELIDDNTDNIDEDKVIENLATFSGIKSGIFMAVESLIILICMSIYLKKKANCDFLFV